MHSNVHCSTVYNSQDREATQMSVNRGTDKESVIHIYSGILLSHKREDIIQAHFQSHRFAFCCFL